MRKNIVGLIIILLLSGCSNPMSMIAYECDLRPMLEDEFAKLNNKHYPTINDLRVFRFMFKTTVESNDHRISSTVPLPKEFLSELNKLGDDVVIHTSYTVAPGETDSFYEYLFYFNVSHIDEVEILEVLSNIEFRYLAENDAIVVEERGFEISEIVNSHHEMKYE